MKLYDKTIAACMELLAEWPGRKLPVEKSPWPDAGDYNMILKKDMAYELGGSNLEAVSGLCFTSGSQVADQDEIWLYGPDLPELTEDTSYARLTWLKMAEDSLGKEDEMYSVLRKMEYTRFHTSPEGYMMRISTAKNREMVRIGKEALKKGLDFAKAGSLLIEGYHRQPEVLGVKLIFITIPDFPYKKLKQKAEQAEKITDSLNHMFQDLKMDCSVCGLKPVCDEVEGMRELHFARFNTL